MVVAGLAATALAPSAAQAQCGGLAAADVATAAHAPRVVAHAANVSWCGGPVMHSSRVHLIFWQPAGSGLSFDQGYEQVIETFVQRVAAADRSTGNLFGLMGQYSDATGPAAYDFSFGGAIVDTDQLPTGSDSTCSEPLPPPLGTGPPGWSACVDDAAIQTEVLRVIRAHRLPTGLKDVYVMITPSGLGSCFDSGPTDCADGGDANSGYCGYHSATGNPGAIYAVIPYNAVQGHCQSTNPRPNNSPADPAISTLSHELAESETDPLGDAWIDDSGNEIADLCITNYGRALGGSGAGRYDEVIDGGHYWIQELWSNFSHACEAAAKPDRASFTVAARSKPASGGYSLTFAARASDPQGRIVTYTWSFGDGHTSGSGRSRLAHKFARRGTYTVVLRTTDSWGNWTFSTRRVRVGGGASRAAPDR
jgi:PKD domain